MASRLQTPAICSITQALVLSEPLVPGSASSAPAKRKPFLGPLLTFGPPTLSLLAWRTGFQEILTGLACLWDLRDTKVFGVCLMHGSCSVLPYSCFLLVCSETWPCGITCMQINDPCKNTMSGELVTHGQFHMLLLDDRKVMGG